jgi:hypothetical protein
VDPDGGREAALGAAGLVDLGSELVDRPALAGGNGAEGPPELGLERDRRAVAAKRQRVLLRAA